MPGQVHIAGSLNQGQQSAITLAAADFSDEWRFTAICAEAGFRLRVDGPGLTTGRAFSFQCAPAEIMTFLRHVREQLAE